MSKHTPGPWQAKNEHEWDEIIGNIDGPDEGQFHYTQVCLVDMHDLRTPEQRANARLIAAAPELLAAVQGLLAVAERLDLTEGVCCCGDDMERHAEPMSCGHSPLDAGHYYHGNTIEQARAAIAKATGDTQ